MLRMRIALAALLMLALCVGAQAEVIAEGTVTYGPAVTELAAMGGTVTKVLARVGDYLHAGDAVAALGLERVYAPCDGTVETVFASEGESAAAAAEKYGGALTILPESLYTVYVTAEDAYSSVRTGLVSSGQAVYLRCTRDGTHRGVGVITEIDGETYRVETTGGRFYNGETVYVYMAPGYAAADRIGKGTVVASDAVSVGTSGDVAKLYVEAGDFVEKGQLLMESLAALPEDGGAGDYLLTTGTEGYVTAVHVQANTEVDRGGLLVAICPRNGLRVTAQVNEADVSSVRVGGAVRVSIELAEETLRVEGRVEAISYLPETDADGMNGYAVQVSFDDDPRILPGMSATVSLDEAP